MRITLTLDLGPLVTPIWPTFLMHAIAHHWPTFSFNTLHCITLSFNENAEARKSDTAKFTVKISCE